MISLKNKNVLVIERIFNAPRETVWLAWTEPGIVKKWWGPKAFSSPAVKMDFKVGGKYLNCMKAEQGSEIWQKGIWSTGVYKEIVPEKKIVCTDSFADEKGNVVPASYYGMSDKFPLEMVISVSFEDYGEDQTMMVLVHEGMPTDEDKEGASIGWNESFDKLDEIF